MKSLATAAALAAALIGLAAPAFADDAMAAPQPALACTPTTDMAKANAMATMGGKNVALVCTMSHAMMAHEMKMIGKVAAKTRTFGPNIDGLLTPAQIDDAWKLWNDAVFHITRPSA